MSVGGVGWDRDYVGRGKVTRRQVKAEYEAWRAMKKRCLLPKHPFYKDYGGRGIRVCDRWLTSFDHFYADLGPRPKGYWLERLDNDGDYSPENCAWVLAKENTRNRRSAKLVKEQAEEIRTRYLAGEPGKDLAVEFGISRSMVSMICNRKVWT